MILSRIEILEEDYFVLIKTPSEDYTKFKERFMLALSIKSVIFDVNTGVKSPCKKQCYSKAIKLCELWFSFEKFLYVLHYQNFVANPSDVGSHKPALITEELINQYDTNKVERESSYNLDESNHLCNIIAEANETIAAFFDTDLKKRS